MKLARAHPTSRILPIHIGRELDKSVQEAPPEPDVGDLNLS